MRTLIQDYLVFIIYYLVRQLSVVPNQQRQTILWDRSGSNRRLKAFNSNILSRCKTLPTELLSHIKFSNNRQWLLAIRYLYTRSVAVNISHWLLISRISISGNLCCWLWSFLTTHICLSSSHRALTCGSDGWACVCIHFQRSIWRPIANLLHHFFISCIFKEFSFWSGSTESNCICTIARCRATVTLITLIPATLNSLLYR